jgi:uncharacterized protein YegP (UPF0339 family)
MSHFTIQVTGGGKFYFLFHSVCDDLVLTSGMFERRRDAMTGIDRLMADMCIFERRSSARGMAYFVVKGQGDEVVGVSREYENAFKRDNALEGVKFGAASATVNVVRERADRIWKEYYAGKTDALVRTGLGCDPSVWVSVARS